MKIIAIIILSIFYLIYIGKMLIQKRRGIQTDQMAKGGRRDKVFYVELILKIATYSVVVIEVISILVFEPLPLPVGVVGAAMGFAGDVIFAVSVMTMKDNWRAGLAKKDETKMVTDGIYRISRNPAFLGFDCVYIGVLLMFFNWVLLVFSILAMLMLHLQILQEEEYLLSVFGEEYSSYQSKVCRYIGRKMTNVSK